MAWHAPRMVQVVHDGDDAHRTKLRQQAAALAVELEQDDRDVVLDNIVPNEHDVLACVGTDVLQVANELRRQL